MEKLHASAPARPFLWEKSYPSTIHWDMPIEPTAIGDYLARSVSRNPDRAALIYRDATISYARLNDLVLRTAAALRYRFGESGSVALLFPNTPFHTVAFFGAASAGYTAVQLSPMDGERETEFKVADSGARLLFTMNIPALRARASALLEKRLVDVVVVADDVYWIDESGADELPDGMVGFDRLLSHSPLHAPVAIDPQSLAVLQYTGGTTGRPKAAMLSHANVTAAADISAYWQSARELPAEQYDRVILVLPLFHAFALTMMNRHLGHGNTVILRERFEAGLFLDDVERYRITMFNGVPTMWISLLERPDLGRRDLSSISFSTCGGAAIPIEVVNRFEKASGLRVYPGWGMSEAVAIGCLHAPGYATKAGSIGMPLPGIEIQIVSLEDPHRILPAGQAGELRIRGPNVFSGYWNNPAETSSQFVDGYFLTGDVGKMDEDGYVFLTDRKKDMILCSGFNVYPRVIEEAIYEHPDVAECVVVGIPDAYRGQSPKAFVALKAGAPTLTLESLRQFLNTRLGRHELPHALEVRASLPRTSVGKLSKLLLLQEEVAAVPGKRAEG